MCYLGGKRARKIEEGKKKWERYTIKDSKRPVRGPSRGQPSASHPANKQPFWVLDHCTLQKDRARIFSSSWRYFSQLQLPCGRTWKQNIKSQKALPYENVLMTESKVKRNEMRKEEKDKRKRKETGSQIFILNIELIVIIKIFHKWPLSK